MDIGIPDSSSIMGEKQNSGLHFFFQKVLSYRSWYGTL